MIKVCERQWKINGSSPTCYILDIVSLVSILLRPNKLGTDKLQTVCNFTEVTLYKQDLRYVWEDKVNAHVSVNFV